MGIDLGLQMLQLRFPDMDLLHVYMLEQLLDLLHHRVESRSQKTELVSARYLHPHRVIPGLRPAEHINQALDRNLNLGVQQVCGEATHQEQCGDRYIKSLLDVWIGFIMSDSGI